MIECSDFEERSKSVRVELQTAGFVCLIALQCSLSHQLLPKDQQTKPEEVGDIRSCWH